MKSLILYSTEGCHLCELAKAIIWPLLENTDFELQEVDIADDDQLMAHYSLIIPVLAYPAKKQQCKWPFDENNIQALLRE